MIYAEILAGGNGTRMGTTDMPKQFLMLGSKPVFIHTIEQFLMNPTIDGVIVCCPKQWTFHANDMIRKFIKSNREKLHIVCGGESRNDSILCGCKFILEKFGFKDDDIMITHDAVRPFITQRIINDNIAKAIQYGAVDTVVEAFDTIVESVDATTIQSIPVRNNMYQGQTPQSFNLNKLYTILRSLTVEEEQILTDACKAFVLKGEKVYLVKGELYNMKITTSYDLKVANALVSIGG